MEDDLVSLDEVIMLPMYGLNNLTLEKMQDLQTLLSHKEKQEELRREHKKKQLLHTFKDIFVDAFGITNWNNQHQILDQLVHIIEKVQSKDIERNDKLMQFSTRMFEHKVLEKVSKTCT